MEVDKPLPEGCPPELREVGDHVRARRLGLGLTQAQAAERMSEAALYEGEERGRTAAIRQWPHVIAFLGYDPHPELVTTAEALRALQHRRGWS